MAAPGMRRRAELKLSDARTTGPSWARRPATMAAVLARATGAELELFDARATGAELGQGEHLRQAGMRAGFTGRPGGAAGDDPELAPWRPRWWRGGRRGGA